MPVAISWTAAPRLCNKLSAGCKTLHDFHRNIGSGGSTASFSFVTVNNDKWIPELS